MKTHEVGAFSRRAPDMANDVIDSTYLPFTSEQLRPHFLVDADGQVAYFERSADAYHNFIGTRPDRKGIPIGDARRPCQIEKDERFWTATTMKSLVENPAALEAVLRRTFGDEPPMSAFKSWSECLSGRLNLVLEATLPSPEKYVQWLRLNLASRHLIPYVLHAAQRASARTLEGATHVDALVVNADNGFSLLVEAKVLSDISCVVSFDVFRNQIARNVDVMLESSPDLGPPLAARHPDRSLFLLLSPACFRDRPQSRLYGWLFYEYTSLPSALQRDLPHRNSVDWPDVARRLGWITFESVASIAPDACPWLRPAISARGSGSPQEKC
jgi:hypothetical protein